MLVRHVLSQLSYAPVCRDLSQQRMLLYIQQIDLSRQILSRFAINSKIHNKEALPTQTAFSPPLVREERPKNSDKQNQQPSQEDC